MHIFSIDKHLLSNQSWMCLAPGIQIKQDIFPALREPSARQGTQTVSVISASTDISAGCSGDAEEGHQTHTWGERQLPEGGGEVECSSQRTSIWPHWENQGTDSESGSANWETMSFDEHTQTLPGWFSGDDNRMILCPHLWFKRCLPFRATWKDLLTVVEKLPDFMSVGCFRNWTMYRSSRFPEAFGWWSEQKATRYTEEVAVRNTSSRVGTWWPFVCYTKKGVNA